MAKLTSLRINLNDIEKSRIYQGEKGKYLNLTVSINDEPNQFGQDVSCWHEQTQEERQNKAQKIYLGNGKVFWSNDVSNIEVNGNTNPFEETRKKATDKSILDEEDDLPF